MIGAEEFEALRPFLFAIAYRMLGSVSEAEDAVQETWIRSGRATAAPASARAYLSATVSRIALDVLRSARVRREQYAGPWLPEPVLADPYADPERAAELAESLSTAALLLLERLSPLERAVFVLREVFGFGFPEIGAVVGRSEAACRQLAARARRHMEAGRPRFAVDPDERERLARGFFDALRAGDVPTLTGLLAADVQLIGDSGGKVPHWRPLAGAERVAQLFVAMGHALRQVGASLLPCPVNGDPGAILRDRGGLVLASWVLDIQGGRVQAVWSVMNPDKLRSLGPPADLRSVMREAYRRRRPAGFEADRRAR